MTLRLNPYLMMDGNAKEAVAFYEKALNGKIQFQQSFGEMPANPDHPMPEEAKDRISHAHMKVGDTDLLFSDIFPGQPFHQEKQVNICISTDSKEQAQQIYDALKEGGQVDMPLQETFFSPAYAILTDKFGVTFQINTAEAK